MSNMYHKNANLILLLIDMLITKHIILIYLQDSFKSLWPSDAIWQHESILAYVMPYGCLMTPSHYLNYCCLLISEVLCHPCEKNLTVSVKGTILYVVSKMILVKLQPNLHEANELHAFQQCLICQYWPLTCWVVILLLLMTYACFFSLAPGKIRLCFSNLACDYGSNY